MSEFLSKEVREGLEQARRKDRKSKSRLRVRVGDQAFTILRSWETGFALDTEDAPSLRGLVDLYDGSVHVSQCLIVASSEEGHETVYEFKRSTAALDRPPLDYSRDEDAPVALIPSK